VEKFVLHERSQPRPKFKKMLAKKTLHVFGIQGETSFSWGVFTLFVFECPYLQFQTPKKTEGRRTCSHSRLTTSYQFASKNKKAKKGCGNLKSKLLTKFSQKVDKTFVKTVDCKRIRNAQMRRFYLNKS